MEKAEILKIRSEVEKALKKIGVDNEIDFSIGTIRHGENDFRFSVNAVSVKNGTDPNKVVWDKYCRKYGFAPENHGRRFELGDKMVKFLTIKSRNRKYPIIVKDVRTGKQYKLTAFSAKLESGLM